MLIWAAMKRVSAPRICFLLLAMTGTLGAQEIRLVRSLSGPSGFDLAGREGRDDHKHPRQLLALHNRSRDVTGGVDSQDPRGWPAVRVALFRNRRDQRYQNGGGGSATPEASHARRDLPCRLAVRRLVHKLNAAGKVCDTALGIAATRRPRHIVVPVVIPSRG